MPEGRRRQSHERLTPRPGMEKRRDHPRTRRGTGSRVADGDRITPAMKRGVVTPGLHRADRETGLTGEVYCGRRNLRHRRDKRPTAPGNIPP